MTKWIVVGVVLFAAACLTERASAQVPIAPPQPLTVVPADTVTVVPMTTRGGLFRGMRARRGVTTVYYPPVYQQPIIPATVTGTTVTGIQQAQALAPAVAPAPIAMVPTAPAVVQTPTNYEVRRGLFGRVRVRTVRY